MQLSPHTYRAQAGFTIIELVVVIALLGVLSAVALPRFIDVTDEARKSVLTAMAGTLSTTATLVHAQLVIEQKAHLAASNVIIDGSNVDTVYGYPNAFTSIRTAVNANIQPYGPNSNNSEHEWVYQLIFIGGRFGIDVTHGSVVGDAPAPTPQSTNCYVRYFQATASTPYSVMLETTGC